MVASKKTKIIQKKRKIQNRYTKGGNNNLFGDRKTNKLINSLNLSSHKNQYLIIENSMNFFNSLEDDCKTDLVKIFLTEPMPSFNAHNQVILKLNSNLAINSMRLNVTEIKNLENLKKLKDSKNCTEMNTLIKNIKKEDKKIFDLIYFAAIQSYFKKIKSNNDKAYRLSISISNKLCMDLQTKTIDKILPELTNNINNLITVTNATDNQTEFKDVINKIGQILDYKDKTAFIVTCEYILKNKKNNIIKKNLSGTASNNNKLVYRDLGYPNSDKKPVQKKSWFNSLFKSKNNTVRNNKAKNNRTVNSTKKQGFFSKFTGFFDKKKPEPKPEYTTTKNPIYNPTFRK
jgi:hypothetical protein